MFGLELDDILINGKSLGICKAANKSCIITMDSGTTYMSMPSWAYQKLEGVYPTESVPVECTSIEQFGSITWVINGVPYTLTAKEWIYPP